MNNALKLYNPRSTYASVRPLTFAIASAVSTAHSPVSPANGLKKETINNNTANTLLLEKNNNAYVLKTAATKGHSLLANTILCWLNEQVCFQVVAGKSNVSALRITWV